MPGRARASQPEATQVKATCAVVPIKTVHVSNRLT